MVALHYISLHCIFIDIDIDIDINDDTIRYGRTYTYVRTYVIDEDERNKTNLSSSKVYDMT